MSLTDLLLKYLQKTEAKITSEQYVPHPLLKALMLALKAAEDSQKDGNYMGLSGDADLTPDKQPHINIAVVVKKEGENYTILEINDVSARKTIPFSIAEKIIHSETLIEEFEGQEVPNEAAADIIADTLGIRVYILDNPTEIVKAVELTQHQIREGKLLNVPRNLMEEILRFKNINEWSQLSQQARALVGTTWGMETKNNLVITPLEPTIPKWKLRESILRLLQLRQPSLL